MLCYVVSVDIAARHLLVVVDASAGLWNMCTCPSSAMDMSSLLIRWLLERRARIEPSQGSGTPFL